MVFEQTYQIKVKVVGNSTMALESFEEQFALFMDVQKCMSKDNITIEAETWDGKPISKLSHDFTFDKYINGRNDGPRKFEFKHLK